MKVISEAGLNLFIFQWSHPINQRKLSKMNKAVPVSPYRMLTFIPKMFSYLQSQLPAFFGSSSVFSEWEDICICIEYLAIFEQLCTTQGSKLFHCLIHNVVHVEWRLTISKSVGALQGQQRQEAQCKKTKQDQIPENRDFRKPSAQKWSTTWTTSMLCPWRRSWTHR